MPARLLKKFILNSHIYGGLLCFSYLIIFGISSLNFNHPFAFTQSTSAPVAWRQSVSVPDLRRVPAAAGTADANAIKSKNNAAVREALGLFGYDSPWQSHWKSADTYHALLIRPGKRYAVDVHIKANLAVVSETRTNPFEVMHGLHGLAGNIPGSALVSTWGWYTELCVFAMLFSAGSGIYLWTRRRNERRAGLIVRVDLARALGVYNQFPMPARNTKGIVRVVNSE